MEKGVHINNMIKFLQALSYPFHVFIPSLFFLSIAQKVGGQCPFPFASC